MDNVFDELRAKLSAEDKDYEDNSIAEPVDEAPISEVCDCPEIRERKLIEFSFGKNGPGLTSELTKIGLRIEKLAETHSVYLVDAKLDPLDDVYTLTVDLYEHE